MGWQSDAGLSTPSTGRLVRGSFAGQTVRVFFNGTEDSSLQTSFFIDDTSLQ